MSGYRACSKQRHEGRGRKCFTKDRARDGKRLDEAQGRPMPTIRACGFANVLNGLTARPNLRHSINRTQTPCPDLNNPCINRQERTGMTSRNPQRLSSPHLEKPERDERDIAALRARMLRRTWIKETRGREQQDIPLYSAVDTDGGTPDQSST